MSAVRMNDMTPEEIRPIALGAVRPLLEEVEPDDLSVEDDVDFDGTAVVRVLIHVDHDVPARTLINATDAIHLALREKGDGRFVYLSLKRQDFVEPPVDDSDEE